MKYKTISSLFALQLLTLPCLGMEEDEKQEERGLSVQMQVEQTEESRAQEDKAKHVIFQNDEDPIAFTPRTLYQAARGGEQRAINLLEYLAELYGHTFPQLWESERSFDAKKYDQPYALPLDQFTQKTLDESLWERDELQPHLDKLFPKPIQAGATYEAIQALKQATGVEEPNVYFTKKIGRKVLRNIATTAASILEEKAKKIQVHENEKAQVEQILAKTNLTIIEVGNKLKEAQSEYSKLTTAHQEKEVILQATLESERALIIGKTQLEATLAETQETLAKTQENVSTLTADLNETTSALEMANNRLKELEQKNLNYEETMRQVTALINPLLAALINPQLNS